MLPLQEAQVRALVRDLDSVKRHSPPPKKMKIKVLEICFTSF